MRSWMSSVFTLRLVAAATVALGLVASSPAAAQRTATMPLDEWLALQREADRLRNKQKGAANVVISAAEYDGGREGRNLHLTLRLRALIEDNGSTEPVFVPVAPQGTVVRDARVVTSRGKKKIGLTTNRGLYAWQTLARGPVEIEVDIVVPPTGPRGSFEYVFNTVDAVRTTLRCTFPESKLVPRTDGASEEVVTAKAGGVELYSVLERPGRIRISGFHAIEEEAEQDAKVYVDGQHLLSIEEDRADLFSVLRLHILYARKRRFQVELPKGYQLVRADGEGAFRSVVKEIDGKTILEGETATGMKDRYEISLRLRRLLKGETTDVPVVIPRLLGAERDTGAVGVELPGRLTFEGHTGETLRPIDPRELPQSLVESSVSPIIAAFRYAETKGQSTLKLRRVPAHPVVAGGVDRLDATTVMTDDGRQMTDLRFTLRNLLRRDLAVTLPAGAKVESAFLDGVPVKPSTVDGKVLLPLARSARVNNRLKRIQLQLVYVQSEKALGLAGREDIALPQVDAPISSVIWKTFVPRRHRTAGRFDKAPLYVRSARFERAQALDASRIGPVGQMSFDQGASSHVADHRIRNVAQMPGVLALQSPAPTHAAGQGAMPVRVNIPTEGRAHTIRRDWVREGEVVSATLWHARVPVVMAAKWGGALFVFLLFFFAVRLRRRWATAAAVVGGLAFAFLGSTALAILLAVAGSLVAAGVHLFGQDWKENARNLARHQWAGLRKRAEERWAQEREAYRVRKEKAPHVADLLAIFKVGWLVAMGAASVWLTFVVTGLAFEVLALLSNPF